MLTKQQFIHHSLHLNLFFLRIIKEHFIFLEAALFMKNKKLMGEAEFFKNEFERLLKHTIMLAESAMDFKMPNANEFVTKYTLDAEKITQFATGIPIDMSITKMEISLMSEKDSKHHHALLEDHVYKLNDRIIKTVTAVIKVKSQLLEDVLSCKLFVNTYPSLLEHVLEETKHYLDLLSKLQGRIEIHMKQDLMSEENFWNHIMSEHSLFIRGLLDPSEKQLFDIADEFAEEFETLEKQTEDLNMLSSGLSALTERTIRSVTALRDFKAQATEGLLGCKIKAIILPLLADHVLREANHYLHLLNMPDDM
ncbi:MAG: hypothetical protein K0S71_1338 [Clostridia bacterium]|jgi:hypothetical protein|nr:hypothetical protein [Clostridia bacterium]